MSSILTFDQSLNRLALDGTNLSITFPVTDFALISRDVQGPRGPRGIQGITGAVGTPGESAYDIAVSNGFVGTEQQWLDSLALEAPVTSVNTKVGAVVLTKTDVGLSNVDNTSDVNKPISTATQTALNSKAGTSHSHSISDITNLQGSLDSKQPLAAVLTNTTASFTTADETKLDSIQANAEVNNVFIQATAPVTSINKYIWIDTSGGDLTMWIEDGV